MVDTAVVFEGYLQLRKVYINKATEQNDYEVVIYAENDNFYKQLGDKFLYDPINSDNGMDFSELDHDWNKTNIINSWSAPYNNGYYYPLIDYGQDWDLGEINGYSGQVYTKDLYPSTNVKYILDKIFSNAGYTYQSNFLNGDIFKNLYIPFNKSSFKRDVSSSTGRFSVGMTQSSTRSQATQIDNIQTMMPGPNAGQYGSTTIPTTAAMNFGKFRIPFNNEAAPDGDPNNLWNSSTYEYTAPTNFISEQFVCDFDISFQWYIDYVANRPGTSEPFASICFKRSRDPLTGVTSSTGVIVPSGGSLVAKRFTTGDIPSLTYNLSNNKQVKGQFACDLLDSSGVTASNTRKLYPGEKLWVEVEYAVGITSLKNQGALVQQSGTLYRMLAGTTLLTFNPANQIWNNLTDTISANELLPYNSAIPLNIKQKDFISSLVKMFNLYIEPSKDQANTLIIEPRDDYYKSGRIKDWTYKLDIGSQIEEQILGETQNKKTIFKYKEDKDFYNSDYITTTGGISYGEYNYYMDNDFITGEKKIELIFSPTPIVSMKFSECLAIPKIVKTRQDATQVFMDHNIRILTRFKSSTKKTWVYGDFQFRSSGPWGGYVTLTSLGFGNALHSYRAGDYINVNQVDGGALKPMLQANFKIVEIVNSRTITINIGFDQVGSGIATGGITTPIDGLLPCAKNDGWKFEDKIYNAYPYLGNVDNPQEPTYDINFGQTTGLYYPQKYVTNNNLYNIYWENFIKELSDKNSRIITAQFYLNPFDISDFRFNDNIFIRDQYYKVNKIDGYDPTREALCKIELIKTQFITVPKAINYSNILNPGNVGNSQTISTRDLKPGGVLATAKNTVTGTGTVIGGTNNTALDTSVIIGTDNVALSGGSSILGNGNVVESGVTSATVVGSNNKVQEGTINATIFADGAYVRATDSNTVRFETQTYITSNYISGVFDNIMLPYSDNKFINYISASIDAVKEPGSADVIDSIDGGRYTIV
jgi:hypothetical protein